jgi:phage terminase large subunit GpA-like protein
MLPTVGGSQASGAILRAAGLTARLRGMAYTRPDGRKARPDLVVVDDPQTDESAHSDGQCEMRERILAGAILGLSGPGKKISGIMPCTVIREGDLASRMLDRKQHPEWHGERTKLVYQFPANGELWAKYAEARADGLRAGDRGAAATEFYRTNRAAMDEGAVVAWAERHNADELSALQHAMNLKLQDERAFHAEYQNEPLPPAGAVDLTVEDVMARLNRHGRRVVPSGCTRVTAFVDVQQSLLYYAVCAWHEDFRGHVVDYGAYPDQRRAYWRLRDASPALGDVHPGGVEAQVHAGLAALAEALAGGGLRSDAGGVLRAEKVLIDANWGQSTEVVYRFCRMSPHGALLTPSHGKYIGAAGNPMADWPYRKDSGEVRGLNWIQPPAKPGRVRHVLYDTNWWKDFLVGRLSAPLGGPGALMLWGDGPQQHRLAAEHVCSEYRVRTAGRGREVNEWKLRPDRPDNHLLDCLVGCCVAASMLGVQLPDLTVPPVERRKRKTVSFAAMQAQTKTVR